MSCTNPNCNQTTLMLQCSRCNCVKYCSRECQKLHWSKHKSACHATALLAVTWLASEVARYSAGIYKNSQLRAWIFALMAALELLGMNRKHASVFFEQTAPGLYRGTYTMISGPPAQIMPGHNCIEFTYIYAGRTYTDYKYMTWKNCQVYLDEFRTHGVDIQKNRRTIEFICDSEHHLELLRPVKAIRPAEELQAERT